MQRDRKATQGKARKGKARKGKERKGRTVACRAAEVMREIINLGMRPGVVIYTTLLNAYGMSGDAAAANKVLHDMKAAGVPPNNFTYSCLMGFHSQAGNIPKVLVSPSGQLVAWRIVFLITLHASSQKLAFPTLCFLLLGWLSSHLLVNSECLQSRQLACELWLSNVTGRTYIMHRGGCMWAAAAWAGKC